MLRTWGQQYPELLEIAYNTYKKEPIRGGQSEFERFLEIQFKNLPENMQDEIIHERMTPDLDRANELLESHTDRFRGETIEAKKQTIIERWQLEDLGPIASYLTGEDKEYYENLQKKYGEPLPRPDSGVVVSGWTGPESPIEIGDLKEKSIKEVVQYLIDYAPSSEDTFDKPSREGLARTLEIDVQGRATDYAKNAILFLNENLPFVYHTHLLRGLEKATKNQEKFSLTNLLDVCEFIIKQKDNKFQKQDFEEGLSAAKLAVVQLFEELFRVKEPYIENTLLEKSGQLIVELLHQDEPFPEIEQPQGFDPATHSLNSVHGVALHSLVSYALYCERKRKKETGDSGSPVMIPLVKETLTKKLDKTKNPSLALHSIFGWYFPQFVYLDKEWALGNRERIFPTEAEMTKYWKVAWSAYIRFSDVYTNVFPELVYQYQRALEEFPMSGKDKGPDRSDEKMASHILKAYLLDMIKLDSEDGLIGLYYKKADDETRSHGNFWLSQVLGSQRPSTEDVVWQKIWSLWQWRVGVATASDNRSNYIKEMSSFSRLLKNTPLDLSELYSVLENILDVKTDGFETDEIIKFWVEIVKTIQNWLFPFSTKYYLVINNYIYWMKQRRAWSKFSFLLWMPMMIQRQKL